MSTTAWSFTTQSAGAPTVSVQSPTHSATGVARNANITLQFAVGVTASFVASGTINIFKNLLDQNSFIDDGPAVETITLTGNPATEDPRVSVSGGMVTINPNLDFDANGQYYLVISSAAIKNQANTNFAGYAAGAYKFTAGPTAVAPTIYKVTSTQSDGSYRVGQAAFNINVKFSQIVDIVGSPILNLNVTNGGFPVTCTTPGPDIAVATGMNCAYTIAAGHNSANSLTLTLPANQFRLNVASSAALTLPTGVTIAADASGPNATLTLPVRGSFSLGDGNAIIVDTAAPTLLGGMPFPNSVGVASGSNFVLSFSEVITLVDTKTVAIKRFDNNAIARIATISNAGGSGEVTLASTSITINPARDLDGPTKAVATKSLTSNVATLTTTAAHLFSTGSTIVVSGVDATFNGRFTLLSASGSTLTYAKTAANVATGPVDFGGAIGTYINVSNKALTSNVATLTTSVVHGFAVGDLVVIGGVDATFNGTVSVASVPTTTTFTYATNPATDVPSAAVSGGYVAQQVPTQYYIQIPNDAIKDTAGNFYAGYLNTTYLFTTGVDTVAPTLLSSDPPSGMTTFAVLNNAGNGPRSISLVFTEGISAGTGNITLAQTGGSSTTFDVSSGVTISSSTATFTPASLLTANAAFTVTVPAGAFSDSSGNLNLAFTFGFATNVPAPGSVPVFVAPIGAVLAPIFGPVFLPGMIGVIIGPAPTFGAGGVPVGLTAGNMAGVDPNAFRNFNPTDSSGLSTGAMGGFSSGQMAALPPSAMGGFNSSQMAALPPSAMGGFNSSQMAALPPSAMGGFNSSQMSALPPSAMGGFNSSQFAALPPSAMGGFSQSQFMVLPPSAMGGFNSSQMAALPPSAMGAFKPDQMAALPPSAMGGMNQDQFKVLPASAMTGFNSNQMGALPPDAISGFKLDQMKSLPPTAITGMQQGQFAALPPQAMIGFKPDQFAALGASAISGMQQNQFKAIPPNAMGAFTPTQMDAMPNGALSVISPSQFKSLTPAVIASMSPEQRNALPQAALNPAANAAPANTGNASALAGALTGWNIDKVPANSFNNFKPTDAAKLSPETFSAMNPEQFKAMPANAFAGFKPDQVAALSPQAFSAMKPTQMASLPTNAFGSFNTEQLGALPAAAFGAMKPTQVGAMPPTLMASMSPQQVGALPPTAMSGLKADQIDALPPAAMATMKPGQVGALTPAAVGSLSVDQVDALPAAAFSAMKPNQVGALPLEAMATMSPQQVRALPPTAMSGLKADQIDALPPEAMATMKPAQVGALTLAAVGSLSVDQVDALPAAAFSAMKPTQVGALPLEAMATMSAQQVRALPPAAMSGLKADQIDALSPEAMATMKPAQMAELRPAAAAGFSNEKLAAMTPAQENALTPEFVARLTAEQRAALQS